MSNYLYMWLIYFPFTYIAKAIMNLILNLEGNKKTPLASYFIWLIYHDDHEILFC